MLGSRRRVRARWLLPVLGAILFLAVFLSVLTYTFPGGAVLSYIRPLAARGGLEITASSARTELPLAFRMENAAIGYPGRSPLLLDEVRAAWEWSGLLRWLPVHASAAMDGTKAEIRTSPQFWNPGKGRISLTSLASEDLSPLVPFSVSGAGFLLTRAEAKWRKNAPGDYAGTGRGEFAWLRVPIPDPSSPIREALLKDVTILFALRGRSLIVSSVTGTYEGARIEGTGEISEIFSPPRSTILLHLTIVNPLEGNVAAIFDLLSKNAKNATLRVTGSLLSPRGEFRFF